MTRRSWARLTTAAMLFACKAGISHPRMSGAAGRDVEVAVAVMNDFLLLMANPANVPRKKTGSPPFSHG